MLKGISELGLISTKQVRHLFFTDDVAMTTVLKRLRLLEKERLIKRVKGLENFELLWSIDHKGAKLIEKEFYKTAWNKAMIDHDHKLSSLRQLFLKLKLFESWIPEHEIRSRIYKKYSYKGGINKLIPDGLMTIKKNGNLETWAIEMELSLKNKNRYEKIFKEYGKKENLKGVWYFVQGESLFKSLKENIKRSSFLLNGKEVVISFIDEVLINPFKAKAYYSNDHFLLSKIFGVHEFQLAQSPAHRVSNYEHETPMMKGSLNSH